jgi:DNA-binding LytR/AlgR family response regulator
MSSPDPAERRTLLLNGGRYAIRQDHRSGDATDLHRLAVRTGQIRGTITDIESRLDRERFVRVHRSTIVNVDHIKELVPSFHGEYVIVFPDGTRVSSSRGYSDRLQEIIKGQP